MSGSSYFVRTGEASYAPTQLVGGAWVASEQHVAPTLGLLAHVVESDHAQRAGRLAVSRLSFDILGVIPLEEVEVTIQVVRAGRTIELVEAVLHHAGRPAVALRAWLMTPGDTSAVAGTDLPPIRPPADVAAWDPTTDWPGGFIASIEVRREVAAPGRGTVWARTDVPLLDEPVSDLARAVGMLDIANGMTVRARPADVAFPNVDLTAHLLRAPRLGAHGWLGFDSTVSFGAGGRGVTSAVLHDADGPVGVLAQTLTVRHRAPG